MITFTINVLKELISEGKIKNNDPIITETKECLKDYYCKFIPPLSIESTHISLKIDKLFEEELGI